MVALADPCRASSRGLSPSASNGAPMIPSRSMIKRICASSNCRPPGTRARQYCGLPAPGL